MVRRGRRPELVRDRGDDRVRRDGAREALDHERGLLHLLRAGAFAGVDRAPVDDGERAESAGEADRHQVEPRRLAERDLEQREGRERAEHRCACHGGSADEHVAAVLRRSADRAAARAADGHVRHDHAAYRHVGPGGCRARPRVRRGLVPVGPRLRHDAGHVIGVRRGQKAGRRAGTSAHGRSSRPSRPSRRRGSHRPRPRRGSRRRLPPPRPWTDRSCSSRTGPPGHASVCRRPDRDGWTKAYPMFGDMSPRGQAMARRPAQSRCAGAPALCRSRRRVDRPGRAGLDFAGSPLRQVVAARPWAGIDFHRIGGPLPQWRPDPVPPAPQALGALARSDPPPERPWHAPACRRHP
jgi:hypothetical protein